VVAKDDEKEGEEEEEDEVEEEEFVSQSSQACDISSLPPRRISLHQRVISLKGAS